MSVKQSLQHVHEDLFKRVHTLPYDLLFFKSSMLLINHTKKRVILGFKDLSVNHNFKTTLGQNGE